MIDRIQTGGVTNLNIPQERIYELGNYQTVATIRDIPDLSFEIESLDVSAEMEGLIIGDDSLTADQEIDFAKAMPLDVISPFKAGNGDFSVVKGIAVPYLTLESVAYRFGLRANAAQTFTFRGDSLYYTPGAPKVEIQAKNVATPAGPYTFTATPVSTYEEKGVTNYALSVCLRNATTGVYKRLFKGTDYTETATGVTLTSDLFGTTYTHISLVYGTTAATNYPQAVHQDATVKPAAIRGKDIDVFVGAYGAAPGALTRWTSVQSFEANRRVNLENDEEFGNYHFVASDYDTADVTGSIGVKPNTPTELWEKIAQVSDTTTSEITGPYSSVPLAIEARISNPDSGDVLKTIYVPDARFTLPSVQGRVQTKLTVPFNFTSDSGVMYVYNGERV